jgi:hypothetical protein
MGERYRRFSTWEKKRARRVARIFAAWFGSEGCAGLTAEQGLSHQALE